MSPPRTRMPVLNPMTIVGISVQSSSLTRDHRSASRSLRRSRQAARRPRTRHRRRSRRHPVTVPNVRRRVMTVGTHLCFLSDQLGLAQQLELPVGARQGQVTDRGNLFGWQRLVEHPRMSRQSGSARASNSACVSLASLYATEGPSRGRVEVVLRTVRSRYDGAST